VATTVQNYDIAMAMADQIRAAVSDDDFPVQVEPMLITSPTPPTVDIFPGDQPRGTETRAFGLRGEHLFTVRCRVAENDNTANQELLYAFMDDVNELSVIMALLDEPTLGGLVNEVSVDELSVSGFGLYGEFVGFQFTASVVRGDS
jgi:hypothetical protein